MPQGPKCATVIVTVVSSISNRGMKYLMFCHTRNASRSRGKVEIGSVADGDGLRMVVLNTKFLFPGPSFYSTMFGMQREAEQNTCTLVSSSVITTNKLFNFIPYR